jgi:hypothetical protein
MSVGQKQAWFGLTIVTLALGGILALSPLLGFQRAQGSLGLLGLWGLTPILSRRRPGSVVSDERDGLIQARSWVVAYSLFWVVFVLVCVLAPFVYGSSGAVPVFLVQIAPFYGLMFVVLISSIAALLQYGRGDSDGEQ